MMFAIYLLKVMLCSGLLLGYYWLALRNRAFHQWNRFYLLAIIMLSLLLPLLKIPIAQTNGSTMVRYISVASMDESVVVFARQKASFSLSATQWVSLVYIVIAALLLFIVLKTTKGIVNILKSYPRQKMQQFYFLNTDAKGAPFSFLNYLVWNRDIDLQSRTGQHIFRHELAHIEQKHTLDKIFMLLVLIPFWINPFFWIIRKELNAIHEFIADEKALQNENSEALSRMILNALYPKQAYLLTSPFFQSSIKRRLQMFALRNQKINYMSRIFVLPLLFTVVVALTIRQESQKENETFLDQKAAGLFIDTIPARKGNVIVEELKKDTNVVVEDISNKVGSGIMADTKNKIYLAFDEIDFKVHPNESKTKPTTALLIVNGEKVDNSIWKDKTIVSKNITVYEQNDKEAIELYGSEAAKGTIAFEGARIISKRESEIYNSVQNDTVPKKEKDSRVFTRVEVQPEFAGDWSKFLQQHLKAEVPVNNGAPAGQYTVIAQFIVDTEGNISDLKTLTKHGYGMEEEVLRVMKLSPNWKPAMQNGRKVTAYRKKPITFVISEEENETSAVQEVESNSASQSPVKFNPPALKKVDVEAKFKGDWAAFLKLNLNPKVPEANNAPAGRYNAIVQFAVGKDGKVSAIKPVTKLGYGIEEEVVRVMKLSPEWEPAKVNGKDVTAIRKQPITFIVSKK